MKIKIAPSILSADKNDLQNEVKKVEKFADLLHVDIMDGKFVPPTTFTPDEIKNIQTTLLKDVHLMVNHPLSENYIDDYIDAGAASITIHEECKDDVQECIDYLKENKIKVCVSIKPKTKLESINKYLDQLDMVLIMSVEPGYSGQAFISEVLDKVSELRKLKPNLDIEIDGGINKHTIKDAVNAGVNIIVAGSSIFGKNDPVKQIKLLKEATLK